MKSPGHLQLWSLLSIFHQNNGNVLQRKHWELFTFNKRNTISNCGYDAGWSYVISIGLRKSTKNKMTILMSSTALKILACFVVVFSQLHLVLIALNNLDAWPIDFRISCCLMGKFDSIIIIVVSYFILITI